jgi:hypothetical protein
MVELDCLILSSKIGSKDGTSEHTLTIGKMCLVEEGEDGIHCWFYLH